jgi:dihydroorotate dehydrogenase (NAD+) catalytic subunit
VVGLAIDIEARRPVLGARRGGLSGRAMHAVALRAVYDVREAHPALPVVGVGGVADGESAVAMLMAGAHAVQVGTATFAEPAAAGRVLTELRAWCAGHGVARLADLVGAAHRDHGA